MADELEKINWLFARIKDDFFRSWLLQFYAHMVQRPDKKIRTAPLLWSKIEGNGKSTLAHTIPKRLAGDQYYIGVDKSRLESGFNDYLIGKWVVALTEFRGGTRGERGEISKRVEEWIADDVLNLSIKNGRGCSVPNHMVITASTNQEDAAQIEPGNRKWAVYELDAPKMTPEEKAWIFEGFLKTPRARPVLRHYFLNYPITTFNPDEDAPVTTARQDMVQASMTREMEILLTAFEEHSEPLHRDVVLTKEVGDYVRRHSVSKPSDDKIGKILCGEPFNGKSIKFRCGPGTYRAVVLRGNWAGQPGRDIMAHICGDDVDLNS